MLERLAKKNANKVRIVKVNVGKHQKWAMKEKVRGVPTFKLYSGGMLMTQFAGAYPEKVMQGKIDQYGASLVSASSTSKDGKEGAEGEIRKGPVIQPMPKNWLPSGVTSE